MSSLGSFQPLTSLSKKAVHLFIVLFNAIVMLITLRVYARSHKNATAKMLHAAIITHHFNWLSHRTNTLHNTRRFNRFVVTFLRLC